MSKPQQFTKAESKVAREELKSLHRHCLSLISTSTQLGVDIRDTEMLSHVSDLGKLADAAETVANELIAFKTSLDKIDAKAGRIGVKQIDATNLMVLLSCSQDYENWLSMFGNRVSPHLDAAYELIEAAREKMVNRS